MKVAHLLVTTKTAKQLVLYCFSLQHGTMSRYYSVSQKIPLRFSDIFSQTVGNF